MFWGRGEKDGDALQQNAVFRGLIWTVHNEWPHRLAQRQAFLALRRHIARLADVVLVHGRASIGVLEAQGCDVAERAELLPHPSYGDLYEPRTVTARALAGPATDAPLILGFGRMEPRKGFEPALVALDSDFLATFGARIRIAGSGAHGAELQAKFGHRAEIDWDLRFVPAAETGPLFRGAACLLLPYERSLTSGILLLALTLGAVVVAPAASPFTELLPEAARRFLFRPGDWQDLRRAVAEVLSLTAEARQALRLAGLAVANRFEPAAIRQRLGDIYDREIALALPHDPEHDAAMAQMELVRPLPPASGPIIATWPDKDLVAQNWGDKLNPVLIELVAGRPVISQSRIDPQEAGQPVMRVIGSGLSNADEGQVVWGSGFITATPRLPRSRAIHAVRGPLTRDHLRAHGIDCPAVYGDAALLMPLFYRPRIVPSFDLGVIRHFREATAFPLPQVPPGMTVRSIDILGSITGVIDAVLSCRQIVSSSLHGLILAHAYGIPATWIKFSDLPLGDDFKFRDYWASVGWRNAEPILCGPETSAAELTGPLTTVRPLLSPQALIEACPFIDDARRGALLQRCRETLPRMPEIRFLAAARRPAIAPPAAAPNPTGGRLPWLSLVLPVASGLPEAGAAALSSLADPAGLEGVELLLADARPTVDEALRQQVQALGGTYLSLPAAADQAFAAVEQAIGHGLAPRIAIGAPGMLYTPGIMAQLRDWSAALPHAVLALPAARLGEAPTGEIMAAAADPWSAVAGLPAQPLWEAGCLVLKRDDFAAAHGFGPPGPAGTTADFFGLMLRCRQAGQAVAWVDERLIELRQLPAAEAGPPPAAAPPGAARLYAPGPHRGLAPPVSVVIATRNRQALLAQALRSVQAQSFSDFEIVVVDDGSTDATTEFLAAEDDPRLRCLRLDASLGVAGARNIGNQVARGRYIAVHDDDDLMLPQRLEWQLAALQPGDVGSYGGWIDVAPPEAGGETTFRPGLMPFGLGELLLSSNLQNHPTLLLAREVAGRFPYDTRLTAGSDFQLVARLALAGYSLRHCRQYVTLRRFHTDNITRRQPQLQSAGSRLIRSAILSGFPAAHEAVLRKAAEAARPPEIHQDALAAEMAALLGPSAALAARAWSCSDPAMLDRLHAAGLRCAVSLRREGMAMRPETVIVLEQDAAAAAAGGLDGPGAAQAPRLKRGLATTLPRGRAQVRRLLPEERFAPARAALPLEAWILNDAPQRYLGLQMQGVDWPGGAGLFLPLDAAGPELAWLVLDGRGGWRLILGKETDGEDAIRLALLAHRHPSAEVFVFAQETPR